MIQSNARNSIPRSNIMHVHSNKYGSGATLIINEVLFYLFQALVFQMKCTDILMEPHLSPLKVFLKQLMQ